MGAGEGEPTGVVRHSDVHVGSQFLDEFSGRQSAAFIFQIRRGECAFGEIHCAEMDLFQREQAVKDVVHQGGVDILLELGMLFVVFSNETGQLFFRNACWGCWVSRSASKPKQPASQREGEGGKKGAA